MQVSYGKTSLNHIEVYYFVLLAKMINDEIYPKFFEKNIYLFVILRPARENFTHKETSALSWRAAKLCLILGIFSQKGGRDLYRTIPEVIQELGFSLSCPNLIRLPFSTNH